MNYDSPAHNYNTLARNAIGQDAPSLSVVASAQQTLDENTNRLHQIITELEQRLQPVLGPSKPTGVGEKGPAASSSVCARLRVSCDVVNGATSRIEDILSRLEV